MLFNICERSFPTRDCGSRGPLVVIFICYLLESNLTFGEMDPGVGLAFVLPSVDFSIRVSFDA